MAIHSKLAVILHADVVDSTSLVRRDEQLAHTRMQVAFKGFAAGLEAHGGVVHEVRGDAIVAEFGRASDAVLAALQAQRANARSNAGYDDRVVPVLRVGIALGEVVVADDTMTGAGVVLAQRLEQLAPGDGVCISSAVREALPERLPLIFEPLGEHAVKGFDEPVRAYSVAARPGADVPSPAVESTGRVRPPGVGRRRRLGLAAAALGAAAIALWLFWPRPHDPVQPAPPALDSAPSVGLEAEREARAIAVLPFENMSNDPAQDYFSDGLTEDIITDLARLSSLLVIARNSTFVYKGQAVDVKSVGAELGVRYVLEGSVRKAGDRIRVTAQLIDANTGTHLWADRYDRTVTDVFTLQDELTRTIVDALSVSLTEDEIDALGDRERVDPAAYDLLLQGNAVMQRFSPESMADSREIYERVLVMEPRYARAHANIAFAHAQDALFGWVDNLAESIRLGRLAAEEARRLDDRIPQLHLARAGLYGAENRWEDAARLARHSIALEPSYADAYVMLAVASTFLGEIDIGRASVEKAKRLNPYHSFVYVWVEARLLYLEEHYEEAAVLLEDAVERNPEFDQTHIMLAATYGQLGRLDDAEWEAQQVLLVQPDFTIESDLRLRGFRNPEHEALYVEGLLKAGFDRD